MPKVNRKSKWQKFKEKWQDGCDHQMCELATKVCLARGKIPSDVLFLGEAPGIGEDIIGSPFVGAAGSLLDSIIAQSVPADVRYALTNLVGCIPRVSVTGKKFEEPQKDQILQCADRLEEFVALCNPTVIVCVGSLSKKWFPAKYSSEIIEGVTITDIIHPAAVLRMNAVARPLEIKRVVVTITDALSVAGLL